MSVVEAEFAHANVDCTKSKPADVCNKITVDLIALTNKLIQKYKKDPKITHLFNKVNNIRAIDNIASNLMGYIDGNRAWAEKKQAGGGEKKEVYLFKAEWCPHCTGFKPTWKKLEKEFNNKYTFITYDSEKDKNSIKKWDIKGFPTIIKRIGNDMEEYVGPRDEESVKKFITAD
jgi:thiol-disulfide isomerase/thioredoxin